MQVKSRMYLYVERPREMIDLKLKEIMLHYCTQLDRYLHSQGID
jgi:hypothetical protein